MRDAGRPAGYEQVLEFCAREPVERVFLEDVARRGDRPVRRASRTTTGSSQALCHVGANLVPSGRGLRRVRRRGRAKPLADDHRRGARGRTTLWARRAPAAAVAARGSPRPARLRDRPSRRRRASTGLRAADARGPRPAAARPAPPRTSSSSASTRSRDDADGFRWRTRAQIDEGRSWLWLEDDVILFKAEASAWTPSAVQIQQVWVDPEARGRGYASRGLRDLCRLLLETTPAVTLFVRTDNAARDRAVRVDRHAATCSRTGASSSREARPSSPGTARASTAPRGLLNGDAAVAGRAHRTPAVEQARALGEGCARRAARPVRHERARARPSSTADEALRGRDVPRLVVPELNDPLYGPFEGGAHRRLPRVGRAARRRRSRPGDGGESRHAIVERYARGLRSRSAASVTSDRRSISLAAFAPDRVRAAARRHRGRAPRAPLATVRDAVQPDGEELERAAACSRLGAPLRRAWVRRADLL